MANKEGTFRVPLHLILQEATELHLGCVFSHDHGMYMKSTRKNVARKTRKIGFSCHSDILNKYEIVLIFFFWTLSLFLSNGTKMDSFVLTIWFKNETKAF